MDSVLSAPVSSMPIDRENSMDGIVCERDQTPCFGFNPVYGAECFSEPYEALAAARGQMQADPRVLMFPAWNIAFSRLGRHLSRRSALNTNMPVTPASCT